MSGKTKTTRQEVIQDIQQVAEQLGHCPSLKEYKKEGKYSSTVVYARFKNWADACKKAGLVAPKKVNNPKGCPENMRPQPRPRKPIEKALLVADLQRVAALTPAYFTWADLRSEGKYSLPTYRKHLSHSIHDLNQIAGNGPFECKAGVRGNQFSDDELIERIHYITGKLGHVPRVADLDADGFVSSQTYLKRFGNIQNVREIAHQGNPFLVRAPEVKND